MNIISIFSGKRIKLTRTGWIYGLLIAAVMGCGENPKSEQPSPPPDLTGKTASAVFSVRWVLPTEDQESRPGAVTKSKISDKCDTIKVKTVECNVYDDKNTLLTSESWDCAKGGGEIKNIVPGPGRQFVILGLDDDDEVVYQGETQEGVTIEPGLTATVAPIDAYPFVPSNLRANTISDTQIKISWDTYEENTGIAGYRIYDDSNALVGDTPATTLDHLNLTASQTYCYSATAYDNFGNSSKKTDNLYLVTTNSITDTGQSASYTNTHGEDGDYDIITPAYTKLDANGNPLEAAATSWAMVRDDITGLVWEVKTNTAGDIHHSSTSYTWSAASDTFIAQLKSDKFGGHDDWRLPSRQELYSLYHGNVSESWPRTINTEYFPNTVTHMVYWTSSFLFNKPDEVWWIPFFSGNTGYVKVGVVDEQSFAVRAVRGIPKSIDLVDNGNGTVTDRSTGLMWQQSPPVPDTDAARWTWEEALNYCEKLDFAGYQDWRLPNIKELSSIVVDNAYNPSIDATMFPNTQTGIHHYWSSTTDPARDGGSAYSVDFSDGVVYSGRVKTAIHFLRAVRGGQ